MNAIIINNLHRILLKKTDDLTPQEKGILTALKGGMYVRPEVEAWHMTKRIINPECKR